MNIAVCDYGAGNVRSVVLALERLGTRSRVTADPDEVAAAELAILPGVGSAGSAMAHLRETSVADAVMMLDLRDTNAMFFKNAGTGRHNMVYRRRDGSIGWVEPR